MVSQKHKQLLRDELNKINLSIEAIPKEMIALITSRKGTITFSNEDLPPGSPEHNNVLYLNVMCLLKYISLP